MTLIVETGASVPTANSYVDLAYARTYASLVGLTLPANDAECEAKILAGMALIESFHSMYQGHKTDSEQGCQFPRKYLFLYNYRVESDAIPAILKQAQVQAAAMAASGVDFFPTIEGLRIKKEKIDVIETEYDTEHLATYNGKPEYQAVMSLLQPLFVLNTGYRLTGGF